jgi:hypothetical protein
MPPSAAPRTPLLLQLLLTEFSHALACRGCMILKPRGLLSGFSAARCDDSLQNRVLLLDTRKHSVNVVWGVARAGMEQWSSHSSYGRQFLSRNLGI